MWIFISRREEREYKKWLLGQKEDLSDESAKKDLKGLRDFWSSDTLDDNEKFLRDYILNKGFKEQGVSFLLIQYVLSLLRLKLHCQAFLFLLESCKPVVLHLHEGPD